MADITVTIVYFKKNYSVERVLFKNYYIYCDFVSSVQQI